MKIKGIVSSIAATLAAVVIAVFAFAGAARADGSPILGFLTCTKTGPGNTYVVFSKNPVACTYNGVGGPQDYTGISGILLGLDLEYENWATMIYAVIGGTDVVPGGLAGAYGGAKASVTVGVGPTVQGGLFGAGNGFELVPLGLGGQIGAGVTGGIGYLQISFVTPAAAPAPMAAPAAPPPPPMAAPAPAPQVFIVYFAFDRSTLTPEGRKVVDAAAAVAKQGGSLRIQVNGYTDTSGTRKYNQALSQRRAATVRATLLTDGVGADRINTAAYGEDNLRVKTPDGVREPQNRRAEITIGP